MGHNFDSQVNRYRRRGSMYVAVLGTSMLVTIIGFSALMVTRIERRSVSLSSDFGQARMHARSAIEMAIHRIATNSNWRTTNGNGAWGMGQDLATGSYSIAGIDPNDGNLANNELDPLVLTGTGIEGDAQYGLQVRLEAQVRGLSCLEVAMHAGIDLVFMNTALASNQTISANKNVVDNTAAGSKTIAANVEAVNSISGPNYAGATTTGIAPRSMPDPSTVFNQYSGKAIAYASLPTSGSSAMLEDLVLSPASNPHGVPDSLNGIYIINCMGQKLSIQRVRIVGTLVVINPGANSGITGPVNWTAAIPNYPALLVSGDFGVSFDGQTLDETEPGKPKVTFNPVGTPDDDGVEDSDFSDSYLPVIKGLVYISGNVLTNGAPTIDGAFVIGGTLTANADQINNYQSTFLDNPPPGFTAPVRMVITQGSWTRVVN